MSVTDKDQSSLRSDAPAGRRLANIAGQMWVHAERECDELRKMLRLATETLAGLSPDIRSAALDEIVRDCRAVLESTSEPRAASPQSSDSPSLDEE